MANSLPSKRPLHLSATSSSLQPLCSQTVKNTYAYLI